MKRGSVYILAHGADDDHLGQEHLYGSSRPVLVVSRDAITRYSNVVLVCPLVDASVVHRHYPSDVPVQAPEAGLTVDSIVLTGQLRAVPREQIARYIGECSKELMYKVDKALRITLSLE